MATAWTATGHRWTTRATHLVLLQLGTVSCSAVRSRATTAPRPRYGLHAVLAAGLNWTAEEVFVIRTHTSNMHAHWRCRHLPAAGHRAYRRMHRMTPTECAASAHTRLHCALHLLRPSPRPTAVMSGGVPRRQPCLWSEPLLGLRRNGCSKIKRECHRPALPAAWRDGPSRGTEEGCRTGRRCAS